MTRTGEREISVESGRLPDNPGELTCMRDEYVQLCQMINNDSPALFNELTMFPTFFTLLCVTIRNDSERSTQD